MPTALRPAPACAASPAATTSRSRTAPRPAEGRACLTPRSPRPVVVVHGGAAEWYSGTDAGRAACRRAAEAGVAALESGGKALDAVTAAVRVVEDDPACNAGTGAVLTSSGTLELDACVMDGSSLASGAVAVLPPFLHPIDIARAVLEDGRYHLLAGEGAAAFARTRGFLPSDPEDMITTERRAEIEPGAARREDGNTVGAVALRRARQPRGRDEHGRDQRDRAGARRRRAGGRRRDLRRRRPPARAPATARRSRARARRSGPWSTPRRACRRRPTSPSSVSATASAATAGSSWWTGRGGRHRPERVGDAPRGGATGRHGGRRE